MVVDTEILDNAIKKILDLQRIPLMGQTEITCILTEVFFDKNFPGEVNSNEQPFYGGPDNPFQNDHLHNHHRDPNADIHIANNQFLPNQIRLKRNKNRFNENNQQQFQTGQVGGHGK